MSWVALEQPYIPMGMLPCRKKEIGGMKREKALRPFPTIDQPTNSTTHRVVSGVDGCFYALGKMLVGSSSDVSSLTLWQRTMNRVESDTSKVKQSEAEATFGRRKCRPSKNDERTKGTHVCLHISICPNRIGGAGRGLVVVLFFCRKVSASQTTRSNLE